jgi:hypothetical protein
MAISPSLQVEVGDDEIIVTQSGSKFRAVYHSVHHKPEDQPQLIVKGTPHGNYDFLANAWQVANDKARELGWIVQDPAMLSTEQKIRHGRR